MSKERRPTDGISVSQGFTDIATYRTKRELQSIQEPAPPERTDEEELRELDKIIDKNNEKALNRAIRLRNKSVAYRRHYREMMELHN